jgi:ribulose-5-phosphate 4-epimerase/fuculose-1-phosphate aldolase
MFNVHNQMQFVRDNMNAAEIKALLCDMARLAYANRMVAGSGGNVSVRDGERIFITPSGCCLGDVTPGDLIEVPTDEKDPIPPAASMETLMHRRVYAVRPQDFAILHLHSYYTVLAGLTTDASCRMPAYTPGYVLALGELPIVGFAPPGGVVLARAVGAAAQKAPVILLQNHGVVASAKTPRKAMNLIEELEFNARLHLQMNGDKALTQLQRQEILTSMYARGAKKS